MIATAGLLWIGRISDSLELFPVRLHFPSTGLTDVMSRREEALALDGLNPA